MKQSEDYLQELVERLENGEPVAECVASLPAQEAEIVALIDAMHKLSFPEENEAVAAAQEAKLLAATQAQFSGGRVGEDDLPITAVIRTQIQTWLDQLPIPRELAYGLAAVLVMILFAVVWTSLSNRPGDGLPIQVETSTETIVEVVPTSAAGVVDDPPAIDAEQLAEQAEVAAIPPTPQGPTVYLPLMTSPLDFRAETAVIDNIQGIVEMQTDDGVWTAVNQTTTIAAGQLLRTGNLSQATLNFYDGSLANLSANTEISIDELNALRPENGFRTVVMTQWTGDTDHAVQFRNDGGSRYEVNTPTGSGIARGTKFHVMVTADLLTRYIVTEGRVDVTGAGRMVTVTAGKLSTILPETVPTEPAFNIAGEGEVEATGPVWTIAGQTFQTHEHMITVGNPQIGDLVRVNGHLLSDGSRVADRIVLVRRAIANRFTFTGTVEAMGAAWTVASQTITVNSGTAVDADIVIGANVQVSGMILADGTLQAKQIVLLDELPGHPFEFSGVVQSIGSDSWTVSGHTIAVDVFTGIETGIVVGDVVTVRGVILANESWLAGNIVLKFDALPTFEFTGTLNGMAPWQVGGLSFEIKPWTIVDPNLAVGDLVSVKGIILSDGTRVATNIVSLAEPINNVIVFAGTVTSMNPWIVDGLQLVVTDDTQIIDNITIGAMVSVRARLMPDGTWSVLTVRLLYPDFGQGCLTISSPVVAFDAGMIRVKHWHVDIKRDGRIHIKGNLKIDHVITVPLCTGWDGVTIIVGDITVIYQPVVIIINDGNSNGGSSDCRGSKCSNRGSNRGSKKSG
ncbi:MAG: hypothetical protein DWQ04_14045 [Chloroflexi bacterium]|nr:MAG: hypothetical protein DWQ04_14045 [Chloroflexota bacterium]